MPNQDHTSFDHPHANARITPGSIPSASCDGALPLLLSRRRRLRPALQQSFATDLAVRGWDVEALPCNRGCRDESLVYAPKEGWRGVHIQRLWRPNFKQASGKGRVLNALWMIAAWARLAFRRGAKKPDVVVIGTDPVLSVLVRSNHPSGSISK